MATNKNTTLSFLLVSLFVCDAGFFWLLVLAIRKETYLFWPPAVRSNFNLQ